MLIPGCLASHSGFLVWADAVVWSARCDGHPYVALDHGLWVVHYLAPACTAMDGDA